MSKIPERIGEFKILREVGRGATATVFLGESDRFEDPVAIKYVRFEDSDNARWNRRLLKLLRTEIAVGSRLDHPNIIRIYDAVFNEHEAYIVMEYFPAESLERYCTFDKLLPIHRAIGIIFKCCLALDHAYKQGVVHRDIKPANILVDEEDNVKITDFGLALNINKKIESDSTFIMGVGSPAYMSPEQIKGYPLNQKTDLYSLGVVLFHLLTGRLPFRASNPAQLIYKIINADPPSVCQINPEVPDRMNQIIRKALEKDLYSRYKNGVDFAKDLASVRYSILDDTYVAPDANRFNLLRKLNFFMEFDDVQLWEVLRICVWRKADEHKLLRREGDGDQRFGVLLEGRIELSVKGRRVMELGAGRLFGEQAWLDGLEHRQMMSAVTLSPVSYLEIIPASLELASEEVQFLFKKQIATETIRRLGKLAETVSETGLPATQGDYTTSTSLDLKLLDT